jgi:hypothetical protein
MFGTPDVNCDIPLITVNQTLEYIRTELQPDMVVWTGDNSHIKIVKLPTASMSLLILNY